MTVPCQLCKLGQKNALTMQRFTLFTHAGVQHSRFKCSKWNNYWLLVTACWLLAVSQRLFLLDIGYRNDGVMFSKSRALRLLPPQLPWLMHTVIVHAIRCAFDILSLRRFLFRVFPEPPDPRISAVLLCSIQVREAMAPQAVAFSYASRRSHSLGLEMLSRREQCQQLPPL